VAKLKPWYQVVSAREDLRENRPLDASEFAVHLDHIREGRAHDDYKDPKRFFERTFLTGSLLDLCSQVLRRLSGVQVETSAVFNMATQFGGGKTHALAALYHLGTCGAAARGWKGVDRILLTAGLDSVPKASVAVFVGTEFDPIIGRGGNGEPVRRTPWGEIAWQLGGAQAFSVVAEHDRLGTAPGGDAIRQMLPPGPSLVLIDELLNYISRGRQANARAPLFDFLQNLSEEARAQDSRLVLCASIPKSLVTEMTPEDQEDYTRLKNLLNRLGKAIMMSAETEIAEIIRRRLFEWEGLPAEAEKTARAYADWVAENAGALAGLDADTAYEQFRTCYPFHPAVLSVFERKWQALPRFQRTRGILRLLALWVAHAWREDQQKAYKEPLIGLGSAPITDPQFRAAMFEQLGANDLEGPVTTDIAGRSDAHAVRLDREATPELRKARLHQKAATVILFESNGGQLRTEATVGEIKTALGAPETNLSEVDQALEALVGACYFLTVERNRYRFSLSPNVNKILADRRAAVQPKEIEDRLRKEIEKCFQQGPKDLEVVRRFFPKKTSDVLNQPVLTLAVFGPDQTADLPATREWMETIVRECGSSGRTFKSAVLFAVCDSAQAMSDQARDTIAWEDIDDDEDTKKRLDESQRRMLAQRVGRAANDLRESIWRAYRHVYLLGKDNALRDADLGAITTSMAGSLVEVIINELTRNDEVTTGVGPNQLIRNWPGGMTEWATKAVRDAFFASPILPRLLKADAIKRTIADGVAQKQLGYARRESTGQLALLKFGESLPETDVEIAEDVFILRAPDAQKLLAPPRLARVKVRPASVQIKPGEIVTFSAEGEDQYGQPLPLSDVEWTAGGGTIDATGRFVGGPDAGFFAVHAVAGTFDVTTDVRIITTTEPPPPPGVEPPIRWRGTVPPQKWMNFYTKVLTRFASNPGLKLEVSFQVPVAEADQRKAKTDETKTALRELGLSEDVES
jgi:hypothetical protein